MMKFIRKLIPLRCVPKEEPDAGQFYKELEIDVLARTLWGEARSEGVQGMEAVACVVLNRVARRALLALIDDPTNGATHYHADYVNPVWADINKKTKIIGRHIFYKLVEV